MGAQEDYVWMEDVKWKGLRGIPGVSGIEILLELVCADWKIIKKQL